MPPLPASVQQRIAAAGQARRRGAHDEDRRLLDEALALVPDHPQVLNARGMRALADADAAMAARCFATAAAQDANQPILWINLATAHRLAGDDAAERKALEEALALDRRNLTAQLRLAELHERRAETVEAIRCWSAVVQIAALLPERSPAIVEAVARGERFLAEQTRALGDRIAQSVPGLDDAANGTAGARRFAACVDTLLGRRRIYTNHCAGLHYPFLPAVEFFDRTLFPWFEALEARTAAIRTEAEALLREGVPHIRPYVRQEAGTPVNPWSKLDHDLAWSACFLWEYGVRNDAVCERCPATAAALAAIPQNDSPGKAPTAFFSILRPGAHIPPHTGVTNTRSIVHLPLVVPERCRFRVGGETRAWREGEAFAFDDTIEHEAWNDSDDLRIVLIFDIWNPYLEAEERSMLKALFHATGQGTIAP